MRAGVKPLGAAIPPMSGAVAIGGAELSCVPAVPFTYICCSPSSDLLESSAHLAALRHRSAEGPRRSAVHEELCASATWPAQLANARSKASVVLARLSTEEPNVRVSQRFELWL